MLENGPLAIRNRLKPVLEAGRDARLLRFDSSEDAYRSFFGLVVRDVQIRLLLGEMIAFGDEEIDAGRSGATEQFFAIYGVRRLSFRRLPAWQRRQTNAPGGG